MTQKVTPSDMALQFLALDRDGFREFWSTIQLHWNEEDQGSDIEAEWFYFGQDMRGADTVISALASAVYSGRKQALRK